MSVYHPKPLFPYLHEKINTHAGMYNIGFFFYKRDDIVHVITHLLKKSLLKESLCNYVCL